MQRWKNIEYLRWSFTRKTVWFMDGYNASISANWFSNEKYWTIFGMHLDKSSFYDFQKHRTD
jgi:hypothetical protein